MELFDLQKLLFTFDKTLLIRFLGSFFLRQMWNNCIELLLFRTNYLIKKQKYLNR